MSDNSKPMFSRPVLALVMLLCTLAIWVLSLTAPNANLPTPTLERWNTASGVPVIWLKQEEWSKGDKLDIRFSFRQEKTDKTLNQATLALLLSDSLPLSTATINQRLEPLAASVSGDAKHDNVTLGLTVSNQSQYLMPTLSRVTKWLQEPEFKQRSFDRWKRQSDNIASIQKPVEQILFPTTQTTNSLRSLNDIKQNYRDLLSSISTIYIVGDLPENTKIAINKMLDTVSKHSVEANPNPAIKPSETNVTRRITDNLDQLKEAATGQNIQADLWQSRSAILLMPVMSAKDWISLQLWGSDLVSTLNEQTHIDFTQLAFGFSSDQPWASWNVQYATYLALEGNAQDQAITAESLTSVDSLPSVLDKDRFKTLLENLKKQLEEQTLSPTWWSYIATQVVHENGDFTLNTFANSYKDAVDTLTIEEYKAALQGLLRPSSYQEFQVYQ